MIGTIEQKKAQLTNGFFTTGSGPEVMLIMGSCRSIPYLNYMKIWNEHNDNKFTIHFIDPFNWHWTIDDQRVDYEKTLEGLETNESLLAMLQSVDIFIHEYYQNAGMFNVFKEGEKNIYQFGMSPKVDICLPNFHDVFILTRDIIAFHPEVRKMAVADYNVTGKLSEETLNEINLIRERNLERFCSICDKTGFEGFKDVFLRHFKSERLFWTFNHISSEFSLNLYLYIMSRLVWNIDDESWKAINGLPDLYANNYTKLCEYDEGYEWNEEVVPLKESL